MDTNTFAHIEDKELLNKFYSDGDNLWIGILLSRYTLLLLGVCMKYLKEEDEAKDAVQQVFLKAITEVPKYKIEFFKSWLYMVAKNICLMQLKKKNRNIPIELTEEMINNDEPTTLIEHIEKDRLLNLLEEGLTELNEEQEQCVSLFYLEKKSYKEITDATGYSLLQVKSFIQNGKRNLKIIVEMKLKN